MKKGCIFDLDGTLVNSLLDLANAVNYVLASHHLPIHEVELYNHYVGNGVRKLIERALGEDNKDLLEKCIDEFYWYYGEHCLDHTKAYAGVNELITYLKDNHCQLAVVTNKPQHLAIKIVEALFPDMFDAILGQQDLYPVKPSPESTHLALMTMKLSKDECVFIGDSSVDIQTAINVEMKSIGVCWGFRGHEELENAGASYIVSSIAQIMGILDEDRS